MQIKYLAGGSVFLVLFVHVFALMFDWYHQWVWFDIPMHFFGGAASAFLVLFLWNWMTSFAPFQTKALRTSRAFFWMRVLFVLGGVALIGVVWEGYEFVMDHLFHALVAAQGYAQGSVADTMDDLLNDLLGALTVILLWRKK